jgi:hypothetical protein
MLYNVCKFTTYLVDIEILEHCKPCLTDIPVSLVPLEDMHSMITSLQLFIREHHSHLTLVHEDLLYYYREAKFVVFRKGSQLLIHVTAPISSLDFAYLPYRNYHQQFMAQKAFILSCLTPTRLWQFQTTIILKFSSIESPSSSIESPSSSIESPSSSIESPT